MQRACENCEYFRETESFDGRCRLSPPVYAVKKSNFNGYDRSGFELPKVFRYDWCSHFRPSEEVAAESVEINRKCLFCSGKGKRLIFMIGFESCGFCEGTGLSVIERMETEETEEV